jgi:nitroimidazol reductase NimA-like FMN-containing flavoprotein (pyridoxamine 5'-phosphate oxidase superfamily)
MVCMTSTSTDGARADGSGELAVTERTALRRMRERGHHDRHTVNAILDEGLLCHVGFAEGASPVVLPMAYTRVDDRLYLHGAVGNRMLRHLVDGAEACVIVTLLDGIVLARSAFHHSLNYRCAVLFGRVTRVTDEAEQQLASAALLDHMAPGRAADARPPTPSELRQTLIVRMPIDEGSAKVRTGGPKDDPEDLDLPVWAGWLPIDVAAGTPVAEPDMPDGTPVPEYVRAYPPRRSAGSWPGASSTSE